MRRICTTIGFGLAIFAAQSTSAQSFLGFNTRGKIFLTSASVWQGSQGNRHDVAASIPQVSGTNQLRTFARPSNIIRGISISGLYIRKGIVLGYDVHAGASNIAKVTQGSTTFSSRYVASDITAQLGFILLQAGGLTISPTMGAGYALNGERMSTDASKEAAKGNSTYTSDDIFVYNISPVGDAGLSMLYTIRHKGAVETKFTFGLRAGYKKQWASNVYRANYDKVGDGFEATGTEGPYARLCLGIGLCK